MGEADLKACAADLLLCGTSGYIIAQLSYDNDPIMYSTYTYLLCHGLLGVLRHGHVEISHDEVTKVHNTSEIISFVTPLSLFTADYYLKHGYDELIASCHVGAAVVTVACELGNPDMSTNLLNLVVLGNAISLGFCGLMHDNYMVVTVAAVSGAFYFGSRRIAEQVGTEGHEIETLSLTAFCILTYEALKRH